jgi:hypothetical protein
MRLPQSSRVLLALCGVAAIHILVALSCFGILLSNDSLGDAITARTESITDGIPHMERARSLLLRLDRADEWPLVASSHLLSLALEAVFLPVYIAVLWVGPVSIEHGDLAQGKLVKHFAHIVAIPISNVFLLGIAYLEFMSSRRPTSRIHG